MNPSFRRLFIFVVFVLSLAGAYFAIHERWLGGSNGGFGPKSSSRNERNAIQQPQSSLSQGDAPEVTETGSVPRHPAVEVVPASFARHFIRPKMQTTLELSDREVDVIERAIENHLMALEPLVIAHCEVENLGANEVMIKVAPFREQGREVWDSLNARIKEGHGEEKYRAFMHENEAGLRNYLNDYGQVPRLLHFEVTSSQTFTGGLVEIKNYKFGVAGMNMHSWTAGRLPREHLENYQLFSEFIPRLPLRE